MKAFGDFLFTFDKNQPMKKYILQIFSILFLITNSFSQSLEELKSNSQKIYEATTTLNYDQILEYTYPKVFTIIPKDKMKEALESTFKGTEEMKVKLIDVAPNFTYGEIKTIDKQKICQVNHNLSMELTFTETLEEGNAEMMIEIFKEAMETEDVTFNKEKTTFSINKVATMIAISDELTKNQWRFLNKDKENKLMKMLLNKKVLQEIGL